MCVIFAATEARPSDEMVERAFDHNKDGAGVAWREQDGGETFVYWKKGLNLDEARNLCRNLPLPFIAHFRIASIGGVHASLTHPFPVGPDVPLDLQGRTRGLVLFHNGHWNNWADKALDAAISSNSQIPTGMWSDSRAMAWMVNIFGPGFMEFLPEQKGVVFGPDLCNVFTGRGWTKVENVWCSNDYFWAGKRVKGGFTGRLCANGQCTNNAMHHSNVCWECEKKRKDRGNNSDTKEEPPKVETPLASVADTPVGGNKIPGIVESTMGGGNRPLAETLTMAEAQKLHQSGKMSQKKWKKFRQLYTDLGRGKNRSERAKKELRKISQTVVETMLSGGGLEV